MAAAVHTARSALPRLSGPWGRAAVAQWHAARTTFIAALLLAFAFFWGWWIPMVIGLGSIQACLAPYVGFSFRFAP